MYRYYNPKEKKFRRGIRLDSVGLGEEFGWWVGAITVIGFGGFIFYLFFFAPLFIN